MNEHTLKYPVQWHSSSRTDVGLVREINEDALICRPEIGLWAVADGMGGHQVGDLASSMIVQALEQVPPQARLPDFVEVVEQCLMTVNSNIIAYSEQALNRATMGSTLVSLLIWGQVGACLWVGDSRLYRLRGNHLSQLSRDHSHVQELIEMGAIEPEEAKGHPQGNVITRAIGVESAGLIDLNVFNTQTGDTFLLCSDGLHNSVPESAMTQALAQVDTEQAAQELLDLALANGAPDNVSVIVVRGQPGRPQAYSWS